MEWRTRYAGVAEESKAFWNSEEVKEKTHDILW